MSRRAAFGGRLTGDGAPSAAQPSSSSASSTPAPAPSAPSAPSSRGKGKQRAAANHSSRSSQSQPAHSHFQPDPHQLPPHLAAANIAAIAKAAADKQAAEAGEDGETDETQICFICAEPVQYWALGACNHRTCHTCSIRLRALYKKNECTFCKVSGAARSEPGERADLDLDRQTECGTVIFTESESKLFEDYTPESIPFSDTKLGILFETRNQLEDTLSLLRFNCPYRPGLSTATSAAPDGSSSDNATPGASEACPQILAGWSDLKRHVRAAHHCTLCDLCCSNKKIFAHEHELFALPSTAPGRGPRKESELDVHLEKQHAMCGFCKRWFYDSDGLYKHCREQHEECFICVRQGIRHQYHLNYDRLVSSFPSPFSIFVRQAERRSVLQEQHYKQAHYLCPHPNCLAQKFIVFETELDLQAHALSEHGVGALGSGTDQKSRKEARRIETHFVYSTGASEASGSGARGGAAGRRGGNGRPPAASFVEPPREEPPSRAPVGERRVPGLGAPSASNTRATRFGGQLTADQPSPPGSGASTPMGSGGEGRDPQTLERHAQLLRRVQEIVGGNEGRVAAFRFAGKSSAFCRSLLPPDPDLNCTPTVRSYRANEMSASDLVDQLFNIVDQRNDEAGSIITSLADLFEDAEKRRAVLAAWRDLRIEENQFPSLAPLAPALHGVPTATANTSARALSAQHRTSTAQNRSTTWDRVERAATSSGPAPIQPKSNPFPALMSASNASNIVGLREEEGRRSDRLVRRRERIRLVQLGPAGRSIVDEGGTPPGERDGGIWGAGGGSEEGAEDQAQGAQRKKGKGRQKVVLMSSGLARG
ncbi:SPOSA6832_02548, partial [Sporobolomyces salmonicolor]